MTSVLAGQPAAGKLAANDVIKSVDGTPVTEPVQIRPLVQAAPIGSTVVFAITRDGAAMDIPVQVGPAPDEPDRSFVGITTAPRYEGPFPISFGLSDVGGPSAGTMFSLGIIDKLTPDNLNGGRSVAGTGTVDAAGNVGAIGGIAQKLVSARNTGTELFLAPVENCEQVLDSDVSDLNIVKVATVTEAVSVLKRWLAGSENLPRC